MATPAHSGYRHVNIQNLIGYRFGPLVIIGSESKGGHQLALCRCDCGRTCAPRIGRLVNARVKSCGCVNNQRKHGESQSKLYRVWSDMITRCNTKSATSYENYGGRGIAVCDRWKSYEAFRADMGPIPPGMSIERIDNDGDYSPRNCRWATREEQNENKRNSKKFTFNGETLSLPQWGRKLGISGKTLRSRIVVLGWPIEKAFAKVSQ